MARRRGSRGRFRKAARRAGARVRRGARRAGGFVRRHARGRSLGLVGKTGVGIMGGAPLVGSALDAGSSAAFLMRSQQLGILSTAEYAFWRFLNALSQGFGVGEVRASITGRKTDGSTVELPAGSGVPSGSWFKTTVVGGTLVAFDILISWASHKLARVSSGVRFMGTKLTGGK